MRYVVIGASAAGISAVQKLRELNPQEEIILISKDKEVYSRCILYHYLEGTKTLEELNFAGLSFDERLRIQWIRGIAATGVDTVKKEVRLEDGRAVGYDKLCIATGSHTNFPPIPGLREGKNILGFRNIEDVEAIRERLNHVQNIFVMGAGLVGIDVIAGLLPYGKNIALADMGPCMMPLQLDAHAAKTYEKLFAARGVKQHYQMGAREFVLDEEGNCYKAILQDGTEIPADLVINCAGVRSNVEFLEGSGIACDRFGLLMDAYGRTNVEHVYGAGDVTGRNPVWPVAVREGITAACAMSGMLKTMEEYFVQKSSMHFLEVPTVSMGNASHPEEGSEETVWEDETGNYRKLLVTNGIITGALLQGDLTDSGIISECIRKKLCVADMEARLRRS